MDGDMFHSISAYVHENLKDITGHAVLFSDEHEVQVETLEELRNTLGETEAVSEMYEADLEEVKDGLSNSYKYIQLAADGGETEELDDDHEGQIRNNSSKKQHLFQLIPRELGEDILEGSISRLRFVKSWWKNHSAPVDDCWECETTCIKESPDLGEGHHVYTGPVNAYAPLRKFNGDIVEFQRRSPITCIWRENDEIREVEDIVDKMEKAGWTKAHLDQKRYVIMETQGGIEERRNEQDTGKKTDPENLGARLADAVLESEQWHIRLFDLPNTFNGNYSHHCVIGQAHRDPWHHDMLPGLNGVTFNDGRDVINDAWEDMGFSCNRLESATRSMYDTWDGEICEIVG